jgi:hypothetical protein
MEPLLPLSPQDSFSSMYYIMQRYGVEHLCHDDGGEHAIALAANCAVKALQGANLLRDAASSAAIMLWAAVSLPDMPVRQAAIELARGLFFKGQEVMFADCVHNGEPGASVVQAAWEQQVCSSDDEAAHRSS